MSPANAGGNPSPVCIDGFADAQPILRRFRQRGAEGMAAVDAEDFQLAREELQLFQRELEATVVGMSFHVGVELGGGEITVDNVPFELRHVDAVGGKPKSYMVDVIFPATQFYADV